MTNTGNTKFLKKFEAAKRIKLPGIKDNSVVAAAGS